MEEEESISGRANCVNVLIAGVLGEMERGHGGKAEHKRKRGVAAVSGRAGPGNQICSLFKSQCGATGRQEARLGCPLDVGS